MLACESGHKDVVQLILDHLDHNFNFELIYYPYRCYRYPDEMHYHGHERTGKTAFLLACWNGHSSTVQLLLEHPKSNVNVNATAGAVSKGYTAFMDACNLGYYDVVQVLLDHSVDRGIDCFNATSSYARDEEPGRTAFMMACQNNHADIVKVILDHPNIVDVNAQKSTGIESYHLPECAISRCDPIWADEANGETGFMMACKKGHTDVVQVILDHSNRIIDLNAKRRDGMTALMLACQNGQSNIVQLLLDYHSVRNIELNARSNSGKTAFGYAPECNEVVDLLLKYPDLKVLFDINIRITYAQLHTSNASFFQKLPNKGIYSYIRSD